MRLRDLGEAAFIRRIRERFPDSGSVLGIGDDAAILELPPGHSIVFCSDLMVEGTHFLRGLHPSESVGYKAVAVNVSDVGAMGGVPLHFTVSFAAPGDLEVDWVDGFYAGVGRACRDFGVTLVGGDTSRAPTILVDVAMIGRVPTGMAVRRSGAQLGDKIYVTGTLGGSLDGLALLKIGRNTGPSVMRHLYPETRFHVGAAVCGKAHAMIDVSDGLSSDLSHILTESRVSARIHMEWLPTAESASDSEALHGGEEYELIIVAPHLPRVIEGVELTQIGEIIPCEGESQILLVDRSGESVLKPRGWDHYSPKA